MTDVNIRKIDEAVLTRLRQGASVRGITQAEYIGKLIQVHDIARQLADTGRCEQIGVELEALGMQTVSV